MREELAVQQPRRIATPFPDVSPHPLRLPSQTGSRIRNRLISMRPLLNSLGVASKRGIVGTEMPDQVGHDGGNSPVVAGE